MNEELKKIEMKLQAAAHSNVKGYSLYSGVELYFFETQNELIAVQHPKLPHIMAINYCRSGRLGWQMGGGKQIYLGPGDFALHTLDACADSVLSFPTESYAGLIICVDLDMLAAQPPEPLAGTGIGRETFAEKFWQNGPLASFAGSIETDAIFAAFYEQPANLALAYQKIKSLELLLYLSKMQPAQKGRLSEYQSEQVAMVRQIHAQLTQNIGRRITIEALSRQYSMNPTTLKAVFKSVYGNSLAAHIREHRMELAARLLQETNLSMAEIGQQVGYESQSKFTAAFKAYYKMPPSEYRKKS